MAVQSEELFCMRQKEALRGRLQLKRRPWRVVERAYSRGDARCSLRFHYSKTGFRLVQYASQRICALGLLMEAGATTAGHLDVEIEGGCEGRGCIEKEIGERVYAVGEEMQDPVTPIQMKKNKVWETLNKEIATNNKLEVMFKDRFLVRSKAGPVRVESLKKTKLLL